MRCVGELVATFRRKDKLVEFIHKMGSKERETILYFAYGSNLWTKRIHENNPSAKIKAVGLLQVNYMYDPLLGSRLGFGFALRLPLPQPNLYPFPIFLINQPSTALL